MERQEKLEKSEDYSVRKAERIERTKKALVEDNAKNAKQYAQVDSDSLGNIIGEEERIPRKDSDEYFKPPKNLMPSKVVKPALPTGSVSTRASNPDNNPEEASKSKPKVFPEIPVRSGYRTLDMDIVEVMVNMECIYKIEQRQVAPCLAYIMNKLAGQKWEIEKEEVDSETENDSESSEVPEIEPSVKRKRSKLKDLTLVLPSRKTLHQRLEDASLMSFKFVAESVQKTHAIGGTVTVCTDNTIKASGHRVHDCKTGRITCFTDQLQPDGSTKRLRQRFTTGFSANISHSGEHTAVSVRSFHWTYGSALQCAI